MEENTKNWSVVTILFATTYFFFLLLINLLIKFNLFSKNTYKMDTNIIFKLYIRTDQIFKQNIDIYRRDRFAH